MAQISQDEFNRFALNIYSKLDKFAEKQDLALERGLQCDQRHEETDYIIKQMIDSQIELQKINKENQPKIDANHLMQKRVSIISWTIVAAFITAIGNYSSSYLFKKPVQSVTKTQNIKNQRPR